VIRPYYEESGIVIYHGDCREVMAEMPKCLSVDALISDPPYGIGFGEYESHADTPDAYEHDILAALTTAESFVSDGWAVVFQPASRVRDWPLRFQKPFRVIAYPKTFVQILKNIGPIHATDYALFWPVGNPRTERGYGRDWLVSETSDMSTRPKGHPCPRPIQQMNHCVALFTPEGGTLLDPFIGSGTTLVAAKRSGRRAIGIEIEERYCEIAAKRLSQSVLPLELPQAADAVDPQVGITWD
jgi:site-specific DNA-methyltransferase (adenine-specific)